MSSDIPVQPLPEGYYLNNFFKLFDFIESHHQDVLKPEERGFINVFKTLDLAAQRLYVRLISRRREFFRSDKLNYVEIPDIGVQAEGLARNGFLEIDPELSITDLCTLATRADLMEWFTALLQPFRTARKDVWIDLLTDEYGEEARTLEGFGLPVAFQVYHPLRSEILRVFQLLFFGNLYQDLTEFVLLDLGMYRYESYEIRPEDSLFTDRRVLEDYLIIHDLTVQAWEFHEMRRFEGYGPIVDQLPSPGEHKRIKRQHGKLVNLMARDYERIEKFTEALDLYQLTDQSPARERRVRILKLLEETETAAALCREILTDPADDAELEFAERLLPKLDSKQPKPERFYPESEDLILPHAENSIELIVAEHYRNEGWECHYLENLLFLGLYGLAFWDIIFASQPGVFFNQYQAAPTDLITSDFYSTRKQLIDERLVKISDGWFSAARLRKRYSVKIGINNLLVSWRHLDVEVLVQAVTCIPAEHLVAIFKRLSFDLRGNRSGFPDLVLFKPGEKRYSLVEVKGPGDRVQANQIRWMRRFYKHHIPCKVVNVTWEV